MAIKKEILLEVKNLKQYFGNKNNVVKAVDDISFNIYKGEVLGLVGESGSGKTTTGRSIIRLYKPTAGTVKFKGREISGKLAKADLRQLNREMQMIFQDPMASLNPRMSVLDLIAEGVDIHNMITDKEIKEYIDNFKITITGQDKNGVDVMSTKPSNKVAKKAVRKAKVERLLDIVGLKAEHATRFPHEFSGGQRQRIGIARALIMNPEFIIADEPISALDVSVQAQVVNLMNKLKTELGLTYLFIAHDLSMVKYISDRIAVLHLGRLVEIGPAEVIYNKSVHPYTTSLLSAIPHPDPAIRIDDRIDYHAVQADYQNRVLRDLGKGHFVLATDVELKEWTKK